MKTNDHAGGASPVRLLCVVEMTPQGGTFNVCTCAREWQISAVCTTSLLLAPGVNQTLGKKFTGEDPGEEVCWCRCMLRESDVHFLFWQSHGRFARGCEDWGASGAGCLITPLHASRLYQKSRHRYNVLVQLFLSDPHPLAGCCSTHSWKLCSRCFFIVEIGSTYAALIFCQSHEEFGCCFWFHMAHCTINTTQC